MEGPGEGAKSGPVGTIHGCLSRPGLVREETIQRPCNWHLNLMPLAAGTSLGHYEIGSAIGADGMGEVYRARDTSLKRDVEEFP